MDTAEPDEHDAAASREDRSTFRRTLVRVMIVQVIALALLWLLQITYGS